MYFKTETFQHKTFEIFFVNWVHGREEGKCFSLFEVIQQRFRGKWAQENCRYASQVLTEWRKKCQTRRLWNTKAVTEPGSGKSGCDKIRQWQNQPVTKSGSDKIRQWQNQSVSESVSDRTSQWQNQSVTESVSDRIKQWQNQRVIETVSDRLSQW